jgi:2-dehydro-3-deoxyphosphooctonate aldolase (KDO 8-P synthase)
MAVVDIKGLKVGPGQPLFLMAGPCVLEDPDEMLKIAGELKELCIRLEIGFCFKSSYTKDNRTSAGSYRGPGTQEGLRLLQRIAETHDLPIVTDIHHPEEAAEVAEVADILQIPAFLCRQTSLLEAAGRTGRAVNVKKGQFLAAADMAHAVGKLRATGCESVLATERGSFFGYRDLVVDYRSHAVMHDLGLPVVMDATHAVQSPGSAGGGRDGVTGGSPELVPLLARCGLAAGADALFIETHYEPARAMSDAGSQLPWAEMPRLLEKARHWRDLYLELES